MSKIAKMEIKKDFRLPFGRAIPYLLKMSF